MSNLNGIANRHDVNIYGPVDPENGTGFVFESLDCRGNWFVVGIYGTRKNALEAAANLCK